MQTILLQPTDLPTLYSLLLQQQQQQPSARNLDYPDKEMGHHDQYTIYDSIPQLQLLNIAR